jgi:hypothetical protein
MIVYGGNLVKDVTFGDLWSYDFKNNSYVVLCVELLMILIVIFMIYLIL